VSLFQEIRDASRAVAERADFVRIDEAALKKYALALPAAEMAAPTLDPSRHFLDRGADTAAFIVTLDTINFGSGWFPHLKKRPGLSGYFTVASALNDLFRAEGPLTASRLAHLNGAECARIFEQDTESPLACELMQRFATALNDLGRLLIDSYRGSFTALIESAGNSAEKLVRLLSAIPFFDDVAKCRGQRVPFYKRAQLTAADDVVPPEFSRQYVEAKQKNKEDVVLVELPKADHFDLIDPRSTAWAHIEDAVLRLL